VRVDARVTGSTSKVFVLTVRNVLVATWVPVLLSESEVDDVHNVLSFAEPNLDNKEQKQNREQQNGLQQRQRQCTHEKVVGLHITVDEGLGVHVL